MGHLQSGRSGEGEDRGVASRIAGAGLGRCRLGANEVDVLQLGEHGVELRAASEMSADVVLEDGVDVVEGVDERQPVEATSYPPGNETT